MVVKVAMPQQFKLKVVPSLKGLLFPNQKEVHYIGGSEVLPPPLETERETEVIRRLGSEYDQEAKKMLIEHNLRLVVYIAKKFDNTGVGVEDLISIGAYKAGSNPKLDFAISKIDQKDQACDLCIPMY